MHDYDARPRAVGAGRGVEPDRAAVPGRTTLVEANAAHGASPGRTAGASPGRTAAAIGTSGSSGALPYLDLIQRSFGRHDVSRVQAYTGEKAAAGAAALGAEAFAAGERVVFAGAPSLHTAAHEAAHVVQQRGGVQLRGGVGASGDAYERHADAIADAVVAGKSSEALLDPYAPGGAASGGGAEDAVQRRLVIGGKDVTDAEITGRLKELVAKGVLSSKEVKATDERLSIEVKDQAVHAYADWAAAARNEKQKTESMAIKRGSIVFTNVSKAYSARAAQVLDLIAATPSITRYLNGRPCFITLVNELNPASVNDGGKQVNVTIADWYFETHELGYLLGMLAHEFAVHPMASADKAIADDEKRMRDDKLPTGVTKSRFLGFGIESHDVRARDAGQEDHIFAALPGMPRHQIYRQTVMEMADLLAAEAGKKDSGIDPAEVTNLIDCFLMDCASILGTNDHRLRGYFNSDLIAEIYNLHLRRLRLATTDKAVLDRFPGPTTADEVGAAYKRTAGRRLKRKGESADQATYQPTQRQRTYLERHNLSLHWIEPDGRCVFGAIGHLTGSDAATVMENLARMLEQGNRALADIVRRAGLTVPGVIAAIRENRWNSYEGDIMMELAATASALSVTVVQPDGRTIDINGGGHVVIRVTHPLAHYHATSAATAAPALAPAPTTTTGTGTTTTATTMPTTTAPPPMTTPTTTPPTTTPTTTPPTTPTTAPPTTPTTTTTAEEVAPTAPTS